MRVQEESGGSQRERAEPEQRGRWRQMRRRSALAEPRVSYLGPVAVWWIPKPSAPRMSLWAVGIGWLVGMPLTAATLLWMQSQSLPLWPFGRTVSSPAEILLRYELIALVYLAYVTLRSLPVWLRYRRHAKREALCIDAAIRGEAWEEAALRLHRYCLLVSAVWRRVPARVTAWDGVLRKHLPMHRRLYVYHHGRAPELPPDAAASFTPEIIPPPQPSLWSAAALIPIGFLLYLLIEDIRQRGGWHRLLLFNAVLLVVIMVSYGAYFVLAMLGRSHYFRFAPGVLQLVKFTVRHRHPAIESYDLRRFHTVLDLSSRWLAITLLDSSGARRETFRLPKQSEAVEAILRAVLSTAPSPPLSRDHLLE